MTLSSSIRTFLLIAALPLFSLMVFAAEEQPTTEVTPKERPKLSSIDRLGEKSRLEVHGGASFTIGGASGGGSFREYAGWASFYDPVTGIALGIGYSNFSGNGLMPCFMGFDEFYDGADGFFANRLMSTRYDYDGGTRLHRTVGKIRGQTTDIAVRLPIGKTESAITLEFSSTKTKIQR